MALPGVGVKRIVPSADQLPPRPVAASAIVSTLPESTSIFFNFPSEKNPSCFESGDQNGNDGLSVPRNMIAVGESSRRIQIARPLLDFATIAIISPLGESVAVAASK